MSEPYASWKGALKILTVIRPCFPNNAIFAGFTDKKPTGIQKTISRKPDKN